MNETVTMNDEQAEYLSLKAAYMRVFGTEDGRKVLEDMEMQAFFRDATFSGDVNRMLINEGARILFLRISDLALSPMPKTSDN